MAGEAIALAKGYEPSKLKFPAFLSEKLDGVPVKFTIRKEASHGWMDSLKVEVHSRQHEHMPSCQEYANRFAQLNEAMFTEGFTYVFVWEVTHETLVEFKDVSGVVRRQEYQPWLIFNLFDFDCWGQDKDGASGKPWEERMKCVGKFWFFPYMRIIPQMMFMLQSALEEYIENTPIGPKQEGWVVRSWDAPWKPGTRHWDYQKVVKDPVIDLWIVGMEEGKGKNANAAGKLIAEYKGKLIGIGPGKLSYADRQALWSAGYVSQGNVRWFAGKKMAAIKHKRDDSYTALRQPTFQHWRTDKDTPDA